MYANAKEYIMKQILLGFLVLVATISHAETTTINRDESQEEVAGSTLKFIGGTQALDGQFPATIQINRGPQVRDITKCTGVAISRTHILLAAHCLFKYIDGVQQIFGLTFFYSYGVNAENFAMAGIKATYLPTEAMQFLIENQAWNSKGAEDSHDIAVLQLDTMLPKEISMATISSKEVNIGTTFRFGGYGCEQNQAIPSVADKEENTFTWPKLKYAKGSVTSLSRLMAQGPTYEGLAKQSLCPGDSGGPIYLDNQSQNKKFTEIIGINNFTKLKAHDDDVNSEINFTRITTKSKLGIWVNRVLAGSVDPFNF